jgi:hypothetical protein
LVSIIDREIRQTRVALPRRESLGLNYRFRPKLVHTCARRFHGAKRRLNEEVTRAVAWLRRNRTPRGDIEDKVCGAILPRTLSTIHHVTPSSLPLPGIYTQR